MHQAIKRGSRVTAKLKRPKMRDANLRKTAVLGTDYKRQKMSRGFGSLAAPGYTATEPPTTARPSQPKKPSTRLKSGLAEAAPLTKHHRIKPRGRCRLAASGPARERCNGQAQARWADSTVPRSKETQTCAPSKTRWRTVACSAWLALPRTQTAPITQRPESKTPRIHAPRPRRARAEKTAND